MLHIHASNRHECLLGTLLAHLGDSGGDPFRSDPVIVPSIAHRRALTLAITDREGVCAGAEFAFLAQWLWQQAARWLPVQAESPFDAAHLGWRVYQVLGDAGFVRRFDRLAAWLAAAGSDDLMRYELAARVAALLEQYLTYRPQWLLQWRDTGRPSGKLGDDEAWQAALWQRIAADMGVAGEHPLDLLVQRLAGAGGSAADADGLPRCVHVFGLASMPPLYLAALQQLSRWMEVRLYVLNPCREYWFDLVGPRQHSKLRARGIESFEEGPRLLASWGRQAQSHLYLLLEAEGLGTQTHEHYQPAGSGTLLGALQDAMLDLQEIEPGSLHLREGDRSLEVHACHSMTRELEVLHDHLLGLFAQQPQLRPGDVLVVTPDLEATAPLIDAVFGSAPAGRRIPFEITGLGRASANAPAQAFLAVLALAGSRCTATELHGVLQQPVVARRFGLDDAGLQQVHDWLLDAGVHWGLDDEHLRSEQLPPARHTLAAGLERLFLAYALPDATCEAFAGALPAGRAEGSSALPLGALQAFADELRLLRGQLAGPSTPDRWRSLLHGVADRFIEAADRELEDLVELHARIDEVAQAMQASGLSDPLPAAVVQQALQDALDDAARGGVPSGRVTFTGMSTLRGLAFPVVCAVGLNDGAFPRADRPAEFDLMALDPRPGDRQRGADQRNVFLDLLLSARSSLYLSYTGRSIRDNALLPPSVLVSELLDVVLPGIAGGRGADALQQARARIVVEHPLQPFSPVAFDAASDPRLRSFDEELAGALRDNATRAAQRAAQAAALARLQAQDEQADEPADDPGVPFFTGPLPPPDPEWRQVPLERLAGFYRDPSRFLLQRRMGLQLPHDEEDLADEEPFLPTLPARSALAQRLLPGLLAGTLGDQQALALARAGTGWPEGAVGAGGLQAEVASLRLFAGTVRALTRGDPRAPHHAVLPIRVDDEDWIVRGGFADLRPHGRVRWRYDDERARDVLQGWIEHLFLCAAPPAGAAPVTHCIARDGVRRFDPIEPAQALGHLQHLLRGYRSGLLEPLHFAPRPAWKWVTESISAARSAWQGRPSAPGDKDKPAYRLAFRGRPDPLDDAFGEWAQALFLPALQGSGRQPLAPEASA